MTIRHAFTSALLLALLGACSIGEQSPNVLVISIDTLRPDHLGAYGYGRPTSPAIDSLAARGALFEDASATSPWTLPSHASLLTGRYPSRHGATRHGRRLARGVPTLAQALAKKGYSTGAIVNSLYLSRRSGLQRGFGADYRYVKERSGGSTSNSGAAIVDASIAWMRTHANEPFFLFLHFYDVHTDFTPAPKYREQFARPYEGLVDGQTAQLQSVRRSGTRLAAPDLAHLHDLYDAEIRELDDQLARLFAFLDSSGLAEDTLVVLTADHGEEFQEHGSLLHGRTHYQEVIAVPLILAGPGVPVDTRFDVPVSLVDVVPTVLGAVGLNPAEDLAGVDLRQSWLDPRMMAGERLLFSEADHNNDVPERARMIRRGDSKLILDVASKEVELFDLASDPSEQENLTVTREAEREALLDELRRWLAHSTTGEAAPALTDEERETLKALGYVDDPG